MDSKDDEASVSREADLEGRFRRAERGARESLVMNAELLQVLSLGWTSLLIL